MGATIMAGLSASYDASGALKCASGITPRRLRKPTRRPCSSPLAAEVRLLRARVRRRAGDPEGAMADVESGLALAPGDARLQTLRGNLLIDGGQPLAGLAGSRSGPRLGRWWPGARRKAQRSGNSIGARNRSPSGHSPFAMTPRTPMPFWAERAASPGSAAGTPRSPTSRVQSTGRLIGPKSWPVRHSCTPLAWPNARTA